MEETLKKFRSAPGLCTVKELVNTKLFIEELKFNLDIYIRVHGHEPMGHTLESNLDKIEWYINRLHELNEV